ncbi:MAG: polysaccharide deacetylase family protein [Candidatus Omnitrophica bacterium]|nr:polysaccharide deacetylase family protein [Candidatus Omnitrophota bacterium]
MSQPSKQPIVLMYHGIVSEWTALPKTREVGADLYDVPTVHFMEQMEWLKANQYRVKIFEDGMPAPGEHEVVLTFDDGEMNNYDQALPVLKKCGFPAYFFAIAKRVGERGYMGWDELRAMHKAGMAIGSHGFSHEILTNLLDSQVEEELRASKRYLERNLNIPIDAFSVPRGFCNNRIIRMAYDAGYKQVFITDHPRALRIECLSRIAVKPNWSLERFELALIGEVPIMEQIKSWSIRIAKRVFGSNIYDWIRKMLLKI